MELIKIADEIKKKIKDLEHGRSLLDKKAEDKAKAISEYDKALAVNMLEIRAKNHPASMCEKLAKGKIFELAYAKDVTDSGYKSVTSKINSLKAELNGWQSIFSKLDEH